MITPAPLNADAFAPFGEVIEFGDTPDFMINAGMCGRFHDLARAEALGGQTAISLADAQPYALPLTLSLVERHPLGSQAFIPLNSAPFLVIVAPDQNGTPGTPLAFISNGAQGVNYHRNTWHGVLCPLDQRQPFVIIDRIGPGDNLQEFTYPTPYTITAP